MEPQIRYCTSADGTRIAYAVCGNGPPLLFVRAALVSVQTHFTLPDARAFIDALAARTTFVTFDRRGTGASQRNVDDLSADSEANDIGAVADATGFSTLTLFSDRNAVEPCARYAIAHQERVTRLLFWAPFGYDYAGLAQLFLQNWSTGRRVVAGLNYPDGPAAAQRSYSRAIKEAQSAETAARYFESFSEVDFGELLPRVRTTSLVLVREELSALREPAMRLTGLLPDGRVHVVAGANSPPYPQHEPVVEATLNFMGLRSDESSVVRTGVTTILFTDIVGHTEMMQRLGDARGREVLREHERITRETLKAHGGVEVKTMGDGFMASFGSVTKAMECAIALQRAFAAFSLPSPLDGEGLGVRCGLNAGEPIEEDGDLFGATVILASRIAAKAGAGEILVPDTVRGLLSGKGFLFGDRGEFVPKGFDEGVRLWDVRWQE